jgi:hypothetical protein
MPLGCGLDCRTSFPNLQDNGQSLRPEERVQFLTQIRMFPQEFLAAGNAAGDHRLRVMEENILHGQPIRPWPRREVRSFQVCQEDFLQIL